MYEIDEDYELIENLIKNKCNKQKKQTKEGIILKIKSFLKIFDKNRSNRINSK